jgi:MFS family permease
MVSIAGSQMQLWALFWHVRVLTNQPIALGGIGLARILPVILFSLFGGAVADVASRRVVLFITQTSMALVALALAFLTFQGHITLWHIYLLTAIQAVAISFDTPARQSLVPNLVPTRDLANAFSLNSIAQQTGAIIGPALTGFVIAYGGLGYTYLINAISFAAVLVALFLIGPVAQDVKRRTQSAISRLAISEGIHFIVNHPIILSSMIMDFFATFFSSANTLMPIFARDILHVGVVQYGWLSAAQSVGAVIAALIVSQLQTIRRQGPVFLVAVIVFGAATVVFGVSRIFLLAMLGLILMGAADTVSTIIRNTIRQLQTPDYIRGRMTSINQIFFMGGPQLGEVEAGVVAQFLGTPFAIISGGVGCILAAMWIASRWPQLRTYNGDEPLVEPSLAD